MDKAKLEERKVALKVKFDKLEEGRKELVEKSSELQRQISAIYTEQVQLQGSFKEIEALLAEEKDANDS